MKERFKDIAMRIETRAYIEMANRIIAQYAAQGYVLTLRQLYYQLVARDLFPDDRRWRWTGARWVRDPNGTKNAEPNYKWLGGLMNDGRMAGLVDWDAIEDRTRSLRGVTHWTSPDQIIRATANSFHLNRWSNQPNRVEVWIEKDALIGVIESTCRQYDVDYFSCRGYVSQSEMYVAAQRIKGYIENGQNVYVLHLGDHDPSGIDMSRDIDDRISTFLYQEPFTLDRLALTWSQIQQYQPPPNPAKSTDSRYREYRRNFGIESWELDALEPSVINDLITDHVDMLRDQDLWDEVEAEERKHVTLLKKTATEWERVVKFLSKPKR